MSNPVNCFFAYSAMPDALSETLENSINEINRRGTGLVHIQGWKTLGVTGQIIINKICEAIELSALFICDLTNLSPNVLFELGYAIARNKRIWITLDTSYEDAKQNFERFYLISDIGYASYHNSYHLTNVFFQERPFDNLEETIYRNVIKSSNPIVAQQTSILYLKSRVDTEASNALSRLLDKYHLDLILDDPFENNSQTLSWYIQNIRKSFASIVHLIDEKRDSKLSQNQKYSFVSGMIYGFDKPLLMLAHAPFYPPVDYTDLLFVHDTAHKCLSAATRWLETFEGQLSIERQIIKDQRQTIEHKIALHNLYLGEDVAENEQRELSDYFVETALFLEALRSNQSVIYVGRKGSGKTANLYSIADYLKNDPRNHVCIIKPVAYELESVLKLLRLSISKAEHGFMIESLWKFLIYTELSLSVYTELIDKPVHYVRTPDEEEFITYIEENNNLIKTEFAVRLERAINNLCQIDISGSIEQQRTKVSEILHNNVLSRLHKLLGKVLISKEKACVLIDNLDKSWIRGSEINLLSDFLFGLLSVSRSISDQFHKQGITWKPVKVSLIIFLRSDIFSYIMKGARERDKLSYKRLEWIDPALLQQVIESRFRTSSDERLTSEKVWQIYFIDKVKGIPTKDYLTSRIIPRPRDMIYLCRSALNLAINRNHSKIESTDILDAEEEYSLYAFNSLEAETSAQLPYIEELLYEFAGVYKIVTRQQIETFIRKTSIDPNSSQDVIDLLTESSFLGFEIDRNNNFDFIYNEDKEEVIKALARKVSDESGGERYLINYPFHSFLEIKDILYLKYLINKSSFRINAFFDHAFCGIFQSRNHPSPITWRSATNLTPLPPDSNPSSTGQTPSCMHHGLSSSRNPECKYSRISAPYPFPNQHRTPPTP